MREPTLVLNKFQEIKRQQNLTQGTFSDSTK